MANTREILGDYETFIKLINKTLPSVFQDDIENIKKVGAFCNQENLQTVNLSNLTYLSGNKTFENCTNLKTVNMSSLISTYNWICTFKNCSSLSSINFPNLEENPSSTTSSNGTLGIQCFCNCTSLANINQEFFKHWSAIRGSAFQNCTSLTSVSFPNASYIGSSAFNSCSSLTSVNFPNVSTIGNYAFQNCNSLTSINCPNVSYIGNGAFQNCNSLTSINCSNVSYVGGAAFRNCTSLIDVNLPNCSSLNGSSIFQNCSSLLNVSLSNLSCIYSFTFDGCIALHSISIPYLSGSIFTGAFRSCHQLQSISLTSVSYIQAVAFKDCFSLSDLGGLNTVLSIQSNAFLNCSSLLSINAPLLRFLSSCAFENCIALQNVILPRISLIYNSVFKNCIALQTFEGSTVEQIYGEAFAECTSLKIINTPNVFYLGSNAFKNCISLESVYFSKLTSMSGTPFDGCEGLKSFEASLLTRIDQNLKNKPFLNFISIPRVSGLQEQAFAYCSSLQNITLEGVSNFTYLNSNIFKDCISLKSVYFPNLSNLIFDGAVSLVSRIGAKMFEGCISLQEIKAEFFPNASGAINLSPFLDNSLVEKMTIPSNIRTCYYSSIMQTSTSNYYDYNKIISYHVPLKHLFIPHSSKINVYGDVFHAGMFDVMRGCGNVYIPSSLITSYQSSNFFATSNLLPIQEGEQPDFTGSITKTWERIFEEEEGNWTSYQNEYNLGDTKVIYINDLPYLVEIVAKDTDVLTNSLNDKAHITWMLKYGYPELRMCYNKLNSNLLEEGWQDSEIRSFLNNEIFENINNNVLKNNIKTVQKLYNNANQEILISNDKIWIPSIREIFPTNANAEQSSENSNLNFNYSTYFSIGSGTNNKRNKRDINYNEMYWWLRNRDILNVNNYYVARISTGQPGITSYNENQQFYTIFGFCT